MSANGLITNLTQEIRDLSEKKSNLQTTISRLTSDKTKLELTVSKSDAKLKSNEEKLAQINSKYQSLSDELAKNTKELESVKEKIKVGLAKVDAIEAQIKMKQSQAKAEIKKYIDTSVQETKEQCSKLLHEAEEARKLALEEVMNLKSEASVEAEKTLKDANSSSETRKREANEYYDAKIAKADKEYQDILQKASEKHGEKIQAAITELADLNDKLSEVRLAIDTSNKEQSEAVESLQQLETLLSEKRAELDSLSILVLDKENILGSYNKVDSKELVETIENLQKVINDLSQEKENLAVQLEQLTKEHQDALSELVASYELKLSDMQVKLEKGTHDKYEAERESLKLEYELKLAELNEQLKELALEMKTYLEDTSKDDMIQELKVEIAELTTKLTTTSSQLETKEVLESEVVELKNKLSSLTEKLEGVLQENKTLKINHKDYSDTKERFRNLNSDYNVAVSNQVSIANRIVELMVTVGIQTLATLYTTQFASGIAVYVGWFIVFLAFANLCFVGYRLYEKLSVAKEMKESMLQ